MTATTAFFLASGLSAAFGLVYLPVLMRQPKAFVSPYPKADVRKRAAAAITDVLLVLTCVVLATTQGSLLFVAIAAAYLLLRDGFIPGQSIGKFLFGVRVISLANGRPCSRLQSAQRNFILVVPGLNLVAVGLETLAAARDPQGQRLGDKLANTQVVEGFGARDFATSLQKALLDVELVRRRGEQPAEVK
jgi:uncharacterized RDD family membrane protein YckC